MHPTLSECPDPTHVSYLMERVLLKALPAPESNNLESTASMSTAGSLNESSEALNCYSSKSTNPVSSSKSTTSISPTSSSSPMDTVQRYFRSLEWALGKNPNAQIHPRCKMVFTKADLDAAKKGCEDKVREASGTGVLDVSIGSFATSPGTTCAPSPCSPSGDGGVGMILLPPKDIQKECCVSSSSHTNSSKKRPREEEDDGASSSSEESESPISAMRRQGLKVTRSGQLRREKGANKSLESIVEEKDGPVLKGLRAAAAEQLTKRLIDSLTHKSAPKASHSAIKKYVLAYEFLEAKAHAFLTSPPAARAYKLRIFELKRALSENPNLSFRILRFCAAGASTGASGGGLGPAELAALREEELASEDKKAKRRAIVLDMARREEASVKAEAEAEKYRRHYVQQQLITKRDREFDEDSELA